MSKHSFPPHAFLPWLTLPPGAFHRRGVLAWLLALAALLAPPFLARARSDELRLAGRWPTEEVVTPRWVAMVGQHAWAATGSGKWLQAVDLTDPSTPSVVANLEMPGPIQGIVPIGSYVWVLIEGAGSVIVDLADPKHPKQIATHSPAGQAHAVAADASRAYLLVRRPDPSGTPNAESWIEILDVSDPTKPGRLSEWRLPPSEEGALEATTVAVADGLLCVGRTGWVESRSAMVSRLEVVDVNDPSQPRWIGFHEALGKHGVLAMSGRRAYWTLGDETVWPPREKLATVSLIEPATPTQTGTLAVSMSVSQVAVSGSLLFLAKGNGSANGGVDIIDVSNPSALRRVRSWLIPTQSSTSWAGYPIASGIAAQGTKICVATGLAGMYILDVAVPESPVVLSAMKAAPKTGGIYLDGNRAYLAGGQEGLVILDAREPGRLQRIGALPLAGECLRVAVHGTHAYVSTGVSGLHVVDVSDPAKPRRVGGLNLQTGLGDLAVADGHLFLASPGSGLVIVDISNPASPRLRRFQRLITQGWPVAMVLHGGHAYLAQMQFEGGNQSGLVEMIDILDPANPLRVGVQEMPGPARDIVVREGKAYVAGSFFDTELQRERGYLEILDVTVPALASSVGRFNPIVAASVATDGRLAWVGGRFPDLGKTEAVDVSNPASPRSLGILPADGRIDVAVADNLAFLIGSVGDLTVAQVSPAAGQTGLRILGTAGLLQISWPTSAPPAQLESSSGLSTSIPWLPVAAAPEIIGDQNVVRLGIGAGQGFFRLRKP